MSAELITVIFLISYFRKNLPADSLFKKWDKQLMWAMYGMGVLVVVNMVLIKHSVSIWIDHFILLGVIYIIFKLPELRIFKNVLYAVVPFAVVSLARDITGLWHTDFWRNIHSYFSVIYPCAAVWMIAMALITNRQRKALEKERQKRALEDEQNRLIATRKAELERMVTARTSELLEQKEELEHALSELRNTQTQLIQSEKMASLGELTAGIAHEIQNPLNFVNNFSEVNKELIEEMELEIRNGNTEEVQAIAADIKSNEQKINYHGKRADAIVKGMLQHSRASSGTKEPTDINALADEYLRLSYHGLRAKDKSFNAAFKTDFDETIGKVPVIPQDFGRVLLNLCNNAFYAASLPSKGGFKNNNPTVWISTRRISSPSGAGGLEIKVRDNGPGIPQNLIDKIFQPFFTTKPTGQGTGLGLSLSYEIIKAHGGELKVETKDGEGAEFIILLPVV